MKVTRITPSQFPTSLSDWWRYDAVVLANVPALTLPRTAMEILPAYVRDLGKGLLMTGGEEIVLVAGGYLPPLWRAALPWIWM